MHIPSQSDYKLISSNDIHTLLADLLIYQPWVECPISNKAWWASQPQLDLFWSGQFSLKNGRRWFTFGVVCFFWLLNYGIYLKSTFVASWAHLQSDNTFHSKWQFFHQGPVWVKTVAILWLCSACNNSIFFLSLR